MLPLHFGHVVGCVIVRLPRWEYRTDPTATPIFHQPPRSPVLLIGLATPAMRSDLFPDRGDPAQLVGEVENDLQAVPPFDGLRLTDRGQGEPLSVRV
jgi:hypothetical protein